MTVSTASNDYCLRNSSRIKYETIRNQTKKTAIRKGTNQTKRKHTRQSIRKGYILTS